MARPPFGDSRTVGERINITPMGDSAYGVEITEGDTTTGHKVRVPAGMVEDLGLARIPEEDIVRESFEFLLEREPATSILGDFDLDRIAHYFPEYYDELRARLAP
jgi:hypothetical protein